MGGAADCPLCRSVRRDRVWSYAAEEMIRNWQESFAIDVSAE